MPTHVIQYIWVVIQRAFDAMGYTTIAIKRALHLNIAVFLQITLPLWRKWLTKTFDNTIISML